MAALPVQHNSTNMLNHCNLRSNLDSYEATIKINKSLLTFLENTCEKLTENVNDRERERRIGTHVVTLAVVC